jgi:hypothetical protein
MALCFAKTDVTGRDISDKILTFPGRVCRGCRQQKGPWGRGASVVAPDTSRATQLCWEEGSCFKALYAAADAA